MRTKMKTCRNCSEGMSTKTEHSVLGFIPAQMFDDEPTAEWVNASVCNECGNLHILEITDQQIDWAERRFLRALVDSDNMAEEEARDILGME